MTRNFAHVCQTKPSLPPSLPLPTSLTLSCSRFTLPLSTTTRLREEEERMGCCRHSRWEAVDTTAWGALLRKRGGRRRRGREGEREGGREGVQSLTYPRFSPQPFIDPHSTSPTTNPPSASPPLPPSLPPSLPTRRGSATSAAGAHRTSLSSSSPPPPSAGKGDVDTSKLLKQLRKEVEREEGRKGG